MKARSKIKALMQRFFGADSHCCAPGKEVLVYIGMNRGSGFHRVFRDYKQCFGFEPNPVLYEFLLDKYKECNWVTIVNAAVTIEHGENLSLYITNNDGASSSVYPLKEEWHKSREINKIPAIELQEEISVKGINLECFLNENGVTEITDYISDIEGMDLAVLRTISHFIINKKIETITCEVSKDELRNRHIDCPDNSLSGFEKLLSENYELTAVGYMPLSDGIFEDIPESSWAMDCRWKVKSN